VPRRHGTGDVAHLAGPDSLPRELLLTILEMMHQEGQSGYDAGVTEVMAYRTALRRAALAYETWAEPAAELLRSICCVGDSMWDGTRWTARIETEDGADPESVRILAIRRGARLHAMPSLPFTGNVVRFVGPMAALALLPRWPSLASASVEATESVEAEGPTALASAPNLRRLKLDGMYIGRFEEVTLPSVRAFSYHATMGGERADIAAILAILPHTTSLALSGATTHATCRSLVRPIPSSAPPSPHCPRSAPSCTAATSTLRTARANLSPHWRLLCSTASGCRSWSASSWSDGTSGTSRRFSSCGRSAASEASRSTCRTCQSPSALRSRSRRRRARRATVARPVTRPARPSSVHGPLQSRRRTAA